MEFKMGDVVELKSGGPWMTVIRLNVGDGNLVECQWFEKSQPKAAVFPAEALRVREDDSSVIDIDVY